jgi:hypothetical protein
VSDIAGEDTEETAYLLDLASTAKEFLTSFRWCQSVSEIYFGDGVGKIVGIFLCRIGPAERGVDEWLWVIVGDIPPAYLVTDDCKSPGEALGRYVEEMSKWIALAREGKSSEDVIAVNVPPTPEWAEKLRRRLEMLEKLLRPRMEPPPIKSN